MLTLLILEFYFFRLAYLNFSLTPISFYLFIILINEENCIAPYNIYHGFRWYSRGFTVKLLSVILRHSERNITAHVR